MTNLAYPRMAGAAMIAAPVLLLLSTLVYLAGGEGMNEGEAAGVIQVWAMVGFALVSVSLARALEPHARRAAATLTTVGLIGAAGGIGYGIDSVQAGLFGQGSIQDTTSAAGPLALQLPGILFPVALIALGIMLARTGTVARRSGHLLAAGAFLFPLSRIPDVAALAVAADVLLVAALVPLGVSALRQRADVARRPPAPAPASR